jgi:serine phosphatase RsbU (regulator of sigma subunit)
MLPPEERIALLKKCRFLAAAPAEMLERLAIRAAVEEAPAGTPVVKAGDSGSAMYIIAAGSARVHDGEVTLAKLGQGELFGEMTVLDEQLRSATVTALEDCRLLTIERGMLFDALRQYPDAFEGILRAVLQRERGIVEDVRNRTAELMGYQKELEIGRKIQSDFLPLSIPQVEQWDIAAFFEAARQVAGDFYDVFSLPATGQVALVIGDVCDKGVGAALYMSLFRSLIRATAMYGHFDIGDGDGPDSGRPGEPRQVLLNAIQTTNRYIAITHPKSSMFASVFFGLLDPASGDLHYINAGHESPLIFRSEGARESLEITGGVLGLFVGAPFGVKQARLQPGDLLYAYTDGVNEAKNRSGEQFGDERILAMPAPWPAGAEAYLEEVYARVREFRGTAEPWDDITMLAVKRLPAATAG